MGERKLADSVVPSLVPMSINRVIERFLVRRVVKGINEIDKFYSISS